MKRRDDLSRPSTGSGLGVHYDADAFGRLSEGVARFFGTARFLIIQSCIVVVWIVVNVAAVSLRWDPYPFILLNLAFSTQAAYAAPLILLAQNRQEIRDRAQAERDRQVTARTQAEAEFLAREIAGIRLSLDDGTTNTDVAALREAVERLEAKFDARFALPDAPTDPVPGV